MTRERWIRRLAAAREYSPVAAQFARFGGAGVMATLVNVIIYWVGAKSLGMHPNVAWTIGFCIAFVVSYQLQSKWSFAGHGGERNLLSHGSRYLVVSLIGFFLNSFWVWLLRERLALPVWTPLPLVVGLTPVLLFILNRQWVFRPSK